MARYIIKRLLMIILVVFCVTIVVFTLMYFTPGDPAISIAGPNATAEQLEEVRERLGLNQPYIVRLINYMKSVFLHFDFGESMITNIPIKSELLERLPRTITLGVFSIILCVVVGIPLGVVAAIHENGWQDTVCMVVSLIGISMPGFWFGMILVSLFSVELGWLPASGVGSWQNYVMPVLAIGLSGVGNIARQTRSSMLEVIRSDYVTTAKAKGLSRFEVIFRHALPNALIPVITVASSYFAQIIGGTVILERVFSIPGVGDYLISAVNSRDYTIVEGVVIVLSIMFALVMLATDILYAFIDPRIKAQYASKRKE